MARNNGPGGGRDNRKNKNNPLVPDDIEEVTGGGPQAGDLVDNTLGDSPAETRNTLIEADQPGYLNSFLGAAGMLPGVGAGTNYQNWLNTSYHPMMATAFKTATLGENAADPGMGYEEWLKQQDINSTDANPFNADTNIEHLWAHATPGAKGINFFQPAGRYSWWD